MCRPGGIFRSRIKQLPSTKPCEGACSVPIRRPSHDDLLRDTERLTSQLVNHEFCIKKNRLLAQVDQALSVVLKSKEDGGFRTTEGLSDDEIALILHKRATEHINLRLRALDGNIHLPTKCQPTEAQNAHDSDEGKNKYNTSLQPKKGCFRKAKSFDCNSRWAPDASTTSTFPTRQRRCSLQHSVIIDESRNVTRYYDDSPPKSPDPPKYSQKKMKRKNINSLKNWHQVQGGRSRWAA